MLTLIGHGYVGNAIAHELRRQNTAFAWLRHTQDFTPSGPIINAAGFTGHPNVDACETQQDETHEGNVIWPLNLEDRAGPFPVVHFGSGCLYHCEKPGGWTEEDEPNFGGSFYSRSKTLGQMVLSPYLGKSYLL